MKRSEFKEHVRAYIANSTETFDNMAEALTKFAEQAGLRFDNETCGFCDEPCKNSHCPTRNKD